MMIQIMTPGDKDKSLGLTKAALLWLKVNLAMYDKWLDDVTTVDGKPGAAAFKAFLDSTL